MKKPSTPSVRFLAICVIQSASGIAATPCHLDSPCRKLQEEPDEKTLQPFPSPDLYRKEVCRHNLVPMTLQELFPRGSAASVRFGLDAILLQNVSHRATSVIVSEI